MNGINLIPAGRLARRRRIARVRAWAMIAAACAAGLAGILVCFAMSWETGTRDLDAERGELEAAIGGMKQRIGAGKAQITEIGSAVMAVDRVACQPDWGLFLALAADKLGDGAVLESIAMEPFQPPAGKGDDKKAAQSGPHTPGDRKVSLSGLARAQETVSQLVISLEQVGLFEQVQLLESRRTKFFGRDALSFRIECAIADGGGGTP